MFSPYFPQACAFACQRWWRLGHCLQTIAPGHEKLSGLSKQTAAKQLLGAVNYGFLFEKEHTTAVPQRQRQERMSLPSLAMLGNRITRSDNSEPHLYGPQGDFPQLCTVSPPTNCRLALYQILPHWAQVGPYLLKRLVIYCWRCGQESHLKQQPQEAGSYLPSETKFSFQIKSTTPPLVYFETAWTG